MLQHNIPEGYVTVADWAKMRGLSIHQVGHYSRAGQLQCKKIGNKRYIPAAAVIATPDLIGWVKSTEFCREKGIKLVLLHKLIGEGVIPVKKVGGRVYLPESTKLEKKSVKTRSGKDFCWWEVESCA